MPLTSVFPLIATAAWPPLGRRWWAAKPTMRVLESWQGRPLQLRPIRVMFCGTRVGLAAGGVTFTLGDLRRVQVTRRANLPPHPDRDVRGVVSRELPASQATLGPGALEGGHLLRGRRLPNGGGLGRQLVQTPGLDVVDETANAVLVRNERAGLDPLD